MNIICIKFTFVKDNNSCGKYTITPLFQRFAYSDITITRIASNSTDYIILTPSEDLE